MDTRELVFNAIVNYKKRCQGNTPTVRQIARMCGISTSLTQHHLKRLERDNRITRAGRNIYLPGGRWEMGEDEDG